MALLAEYDVALNLRPVYPLAIREPDFFERNHPNWIGYTMRDVIRLAEYLEIPMAIPNPDPIVQDLATRKIAEQQPYIFQLNRMGQAAARQGKSLIFCDEVSRHIWGGTANWHEGAYLRQAAEKAGLDFADLERMADDEAEILDAEIAKNQADLEAAGHWGVPTLVFDDEPFFGQDRIDIAIWKMKQKGLSPRA